MTLFAQESEKKKGMFDWITSKNLVNLVPKRTLNNNTT
jgi:hypothetical protein